MAEQRQIEKNMAEHRQIEKNMAEQRQIEKTGPIIDKQRFKILF